MGKALFGVSFLIPFKKKGKREMEIQIEHRLTEVESRSKSNTKRLDELEKRQDNLEDLTSTVKVLAVKEENIEKDVKEIKDNVNHIKDKPAKRWESFVTQLISILVAAVAGYILAKFGL